MSFRHYVESRAASTPARETALGTLSIDSRTEDGELSRVQFLKSSKLPPSGLVDMRSPVSRLAQNAALVSLERLAETEPHAFSATVPAEPFVVLPATEATRLHQLATAVERQTGAKNATDFMSWKASQMLVDPAELRRLNFIAAQVRNYLGMTDGNEFGKWLARAIVVLQHVKRAAGALA